MKKNQIEKLVEEIIRETINENADWAKMMKNDALGDSFKSAQAEDPQASDKEEFRRKMQRMSDKEKSYSHLGGKPEWLTEVEAAMNSFSINHVFSLSKRAYMEGYYKAVRDYAETNAVNNFEESESEGNFEQSRIVAFLQSLVKKRGKKSYFNSGGKPEGLSEGDRFNRVADSLYDTIWDPMKALLTRSGLDRDKIDEIEDDFIKSELTRMVNFIAGFMEDGVRK